MTPLRATARPGGAVLVDGVIRRPPVLDYKLVDVARSGYSEATCRIPRGGLVKSSRVFPGYTSGPRSPRGIEADGLLKEGTSGRRLGPPTGEVPGSSKQRD